jgi:uncharacterized tellurite resistance protein B-like protein
VQTLLDWAADLANKAEPGTGSELFALWQTKSPDKLAKAEAVTLATLLSRHGLGVEPDVRLGGPPITPGSKVLVFRTGDEPSPQTATPAYAAAATLLHLAIAIAAADGHVSDEEQQTLGLYLKDALELTQGERVRLAAHMRWLTATGVKLTGLSKRLEALSNAQRTSIGDLLVAVAAADGVISPEEVTALSKIFKLLQLDPADVHSRLHTLLTGARPSPATQPVTVREAGDPDPGYPISRPAVPAATSNGFALDATVIQAKFAEAAAAGALLADIFKEDGTDGPEPTPLPPAPTGNVVGTLDIAHSNFVRALLGRATWTRSELEDLADEYSLLPDGAVDTINEFALDTAGEPLIEEEALDTFAINNYAREGLAA